MSSDQFNSDVVASLMEAFPDVTCNTEPLGGRVLVQLRRMAPKTKSGIVLVEDTRDTVKWNNQVGKVVALGPLAFRNRETKELWPEGAWVKLGDYVRVPRWDGDRIEVPVKDEDPVIFVLFNDTQLLGRITGDPLQQKVYIL